MLSVNNLSVSYLAPVFENISISVQAEEIVCLVGKSGSGKTTLLNKILEGDKKIERTNSISLITQESLLLDWRTALQNVLLPLELQGRVTPLAVNKAKELLTTVGLLQSINKLPSELSGGMKQRVTLARGLLQEAELYLFDEPLSAIDFDLRLLLGEEIRKFIISNKRGAIFITHNIEEAISVGDRIVVLGDSPGRIVMELPISLSKNDRHPAILRSRPEFSDLFSQLWKALGS